MSNVIFEGPTSASDLVLGFTIFLYQLYILHFYEIYTRVSCYTVFKFMTCINVVSRRLLLFIYNIYSEYV